MALGTPTLHGSAGASTTSATTGAFTPAAGELLIALCGARVGAATIPTISDSLGGTWTAVHADSDQDAGNLVGNVFYQVIGGSPASMTVTATSTGATQTGIHVIGITGAGTDFTNFVFDLDTVGDPSLTMAAFATGSLCLSLYVNNAGGSLVTSPTGHTELIDSAIATSLRMVSGYDMTPDVSMAWVGTGADTIGYGLEIKEAGGGGANTKRSFGMVIG